MYPLRLYGKQCIRWSFKWNVVRVSAIKQCIATPYKTMIPPVVNTNALSIEFAETIGKLAVSSDCVKEGKVLPKRDKALTKAAADVMRNAILNDDGEMVSFMLAMLSEGKLSNGPIEKLWKSYDPSISRFGEGEDAQYFTRMNSERKREKVSLIADMLPVSLAKKKSA